LGLQNIGNDFSLWGACAIGLIRLILHLWLCLNPQDGFNSLLDTRKQQVGKNAA
jgi:hypothetical protein